MDSDKSSMFSCRSCTATDAVTNNLIDINNKYVCSRSTLIHISIIHNIHTVLENGRYWRITLNHLVLCRTQCTKALSQGCSSSKPLHNSQIVKGISPRHEEAAKQKLQLYMSPHLRIPKNLILKGKPLWLRWSSGGKHRETKWRVAAAALNALADWEKLWQMTVSPSKCCVLSISVGKVSSVVTSPYLNIRENQLPVVNSTLDLCITITHDLTPCMHYKKTLLLKLICEQMPYIAVLFLRTTCPFYVHSLSMLGHF